MANNVKMYDMLISCPVDVEDMIQIVEEVIENFKQLSIPSNNLLPLFTSIDYEEGYRETLNEILLNYADLRKQLILLGNGGILDNSYIRNPAEE